MELFHSMIVNAGMDEADDADMLEVSAEGWTSREANDQQSSEGTTIPSKAERFSSKKSNLSTYRKAATHAQGPQCRVHYDFDKRTPYRVESARAFEQYNEAWNSIPPHQAQHPVPRLPGIHMSNGNAYSWITATSPEKENLIKARTLHFYLYEVGAEIDETSQMYVKIKRMKEVSKVQKLIKFLKRTELPRWHSDRLNLRTGKPGLVDGTIGVTGDVVTIRTAIQQLIEACEEFLEARIAA